MEQELDRCFKRREELLRKMEETVAALAAAAEQVCTVGSTGSVYVCKNRVAIKEIHASYSTIS